jgi:glycosyltransferase involved in cell wall biosynthesis
MNLPQSSKPPLVVIATPVYNGAAFLAETMECVQAQTYPNILHLILDNASSDATPQIIRSFEGRRVPLSVTRNSETVSYKENWERLVSIIPGDAAFVRILCADDKIMPTATERVTEIAVAHPNAGVSGCGFQVMDEVQESKWPAGVSVVPGREAARRFFMGEGEIIGPHLTYRADVLGMRKPFFDPSFNGIDTEACLYLLQHVDWACTTEVLAWTRVHDTSLSHTVMHPAGKHFADWLRYIHKYGRWAMDPADYARHSRAFQRYYLRRLVLWTLHKKQGATIREHLALARELGGAPGILDFADAFADLILKRLKLRQPVPAGYPLG